MNLLNVCLLVFSALVTLFLLIGVIADMNRKSRFMSSFIILLISNILMQLSEARIWLFAVGRSGIYPKNHPLRISVRYGINLTASLLGGCSVLNYFFASPMGVYSTLFINIKLRVSFSTTNQVSAQSVSMLRLICNQHQAL